MLRSNSFRLTFSCSSSPVVSSGHALGVIGLVRELEAFHFHLGGLEEDKKQTAPLNIQVRTSQCHLWNVVQPMKCCGIKVIVHPNDKFTTVVPYLVSSIRTSRDWEILRKHSSNCDLGELSPLFQRDGFHLIQCAFFLFIHEMFPNPT